MIWSVKLPLEQLVECRVQEVRAAGGDVVYALTNEGHLFKIVSGKKIVYLEQNFALKELDRGYKVEWLRISKDGQWVSRISG